MSGGGDRDDVLRDTLAGHFVMLRTLVPSQDGPSHEWACHCGLRFGFSDSAIDHIAEELRRSLRLREEWAATDETSVEFEQWPSDKSVRATREAAEAEFVDDGDDAVVRRYVSDWRLA